LSGLAGQEAQAINCGSRLGQKGGTPSLLKSPLTNRKSEKFRLFLLS